jgi:branched-chain amino acid transport system substrate-binding protein
MLRILLTLLALAAGIAQAQGVTDSEIVLGQSAALSGPAAQLGQDMRDGALLYFQHVNAQGGVHGRRIVLKTLDDGYEANRAAANTRKLVDDDKVFALFGYVGTPTSAASMPIFTQAKVPFVGPFTGAESLRNPVNPYIFNVRASYFDETEAIVQHLSAMGIDRIAIFYQDDAYGQAGLAGVERALKKRNLALVARGTVERNTVQVEKAVAAIGKSDPQAVVMISAYTSCAAFIKQMKAANMNPTFWNVSFVGSKALAEELGPEGRGVEISLRHARGLRRREGDGRGPQARGQEARPRGLREGDGIDDRLRRGRLQGELRAGESQRVEIRGPHDHLQGREVREMSCHAGEGRHPI